MAQRFGNQGELLVRVFGANREGLLKMNINRPFQGDICWELNVRRQSVFFLSVSVTAQPLLILIPSASSSSRLGVTTELQRRIEIWLGGVTSTAKGSKQKRLLANNHKSGKEQGTNKWDLMS